MKWLWVVLFLVGCSDPIFSDTAKRAEEICKPFGGMYLVRGDNFAREWQRAVVICQDGTNITFTVKRP